MPTPTSACQILQLDRTDATAISAVRTDANGTPIRSYTKGILRAGVTVRNVAKQSLVLSRDFVERVMQTATQMLADGVKIPLQLGHTTSAEATRGYATSLFFDGDELKANVDLIGEDGMKLASRADVSVYVEPTYVVNGKTYRDALVNIAVVPDPQVIGLSPFAPVALAASLSSQVFSLSTSQGTAQMSWKNLAPIFGIDPTKFDDTTGPTEVERHAKALKSSNEALTLSLGKANDSAAALQLSVTRLQATGPAVDQDLLDQHAEIVTAKFGALTERGILLPAQRDKLTALFTGKQGTRPALCLSRKHAEHAGLENALALSVIDILGESKGKAIGAKTGAQGEAKTDDAPEAPGTDFFAKLDSFLPGAAAKK